MHARTPIAINGRPVWFQGRPVSVGYNIVSPGYFETLGIQIVRGYVFSEQDAQSRARLVIIDEAAAKRFWPGEDPVGKTVTFDVAGPSRIIGVARNGRTAFVWRPDDALFYVLSPAGSARDMYIVLRTSAATTAAALESAIRKQVLASNPHAQIAVRALDESLDFQLAPFRACATVAGALGALALLLAGMGLYGVMSYAVTSRTREIGVRMALGASRSDVLRLVLADSLRLILLGIGLGVVGAAIVSRVLMAVLIGISPVDPIAFSGVSCFLLMVALMATWMPARRAMRVDPMVALRYE